MEKKEEGGGGGGGSVYTFDAGKGLLETRNMDNWKYSEKGEMSKKCPRLSSLSFCQLRRCQECFVFVSFQKLSLIVVGTGFLFSFVFHWGTVEPVSSAGSRRKEQEQGNPVKCFFF